jgi:hypothetical protein
VELQVKVIEEDKKSSRDTGYDSRSGRASTFHA